MYEFKKGDKVRCVHTGSSVDAGQEYVVFSVEGPRNMVEDQDQILRFKGNEDGAYAWRFELVKSIEKPDYYRIKVKGAEFDAIDLWHALDLSPCAATALKYLIRQGKKTPDRIADLKKAREFLDREIQRLESEPK